MATEVRLGWPDTRWRSEVADRHHGHHSLPLVDEMATQISSALGGMQCGNRGPIGHPAGVANIHCDKIVIADCTSEWKSSSTGAGGREG